MGGKHCTTHGAWKKHIVQSMGHGALYKPAECCTTHGAWARKCCTIHANYVVQQLHGPWVMGLCHVVWPMGHGKKVAEGARDMVDASAYDFLISGCELRARL